MKSCVQCGMENTSETRFCRGCGAPFPLITPTPPAQVPDRTPTRDADEFTRRLGRSSRGLWGALAVVLLLFVGGLGWLLGGGGRNNRSAQVSDLSSSILSPTPTISGVMMPDATSTSVSDEPSFATTAPEPTPTSATWAGERYPQTRMKTLNDSDVASWTFDETRYAINEMYARHGYDFRNASVRRRFAQFAWYRRVRVAGRSQAQAERLFDSVEQANRRLLVAHRDGTNNAGGLWHGHGE